MRIRTLWYQDCYGNAYTAQLYSAFVLHWCHTIQPAETLSFLEWLKYIRTYGLHSFDAHVCEHKEQMRNAREQGLKSSVVVQSKMICPAAYMTSAPLAVPTSRFLRTHIPRTIR